MAYAHEDGKMGRWERCVSHPPFLGQQLEGMRLDPNEGDWRTNSAGDAREGEQGRGLALLSGQVSECRPSAPPSHRHCGSYEPLLTGLILPRSPLEEHRCAWPFLPLSPLPPNVG